MREFPARIARYTNNRMSRFNTPAQSEEGVPRLPADAGWGALTIWTIKNRFFRPLREGEQAWMLLRLEECPHLTVRGLAVELAERGHRVSPNTVWSLLRKAGHSFKKKPVRQRAGSAQDRTATGAVEEVSGPA